VREVGDMLSVVFIDAPPTLAPAVATMVARCEKALGAGRCRPSTDGSESAESRYYALLQTDDTRLQTATIELHRAAPGGAVVAHRDLVFSEQDAPESRWAAVGLVVAGLVAAQDARDATPRDAEAEHRRPPAVQRHVRRDEWARWGADLGGIAGPGFAVGPYRWGGFGRFWHRLQPAPHMLLLGSLRYAARSGDLDARWFSVGAGLGARLGGQKSRVNLDITGELIAERMAVAARLAAGGNTDSAAQARFGGRINLSLGVGLTTFVSLVLGVDVTALTPPISVEVQNTVVGREPSGRVALLAGVRVAP
jgi:hypothetical protein